MARVLCVGNAVVDFVLRVPAFTDRPEKIVASEAAIVGGGCAATAAVAVARLGGEAWLAARLGSDPVGDMILAGLQAEGVNCTLVERVEGARSSFSAVQVDAAGERQIVNFRGAGMPEGPGRVGGAPAVGAVLADTRWTAGAAAALALARARAIPGVLDAEAPIDPALLAAASHVAFSAQGLASLAPGLAPAAALAVVAPGLSGWACVTDGADGVHLPGGAHLPAFAVAVVDTLGAGDVWHGAFALRLAEGADETAAVRFANAAAALKCTHPGGRAGCPDRAATEEFLKERTR
ncbi:MAG: sugar kinase [Rhodobacteraceae bacterium]|nr:sugar kinase [Paracoccaceae bacterium]